MIHTHYFIYSFILQPFRSPYLSLLSSSSYHGRETLARTLNEPHPFNFHPSCGLFILSSFFWSCAWLHDQYLIKIQYLTLNIKHSKGNIHSKEQLGYNSLGNCKCTKYILKEGSWLILSQPEWTGRERDNMNETKQQKTLEPLAMVADQDENASGQTSKGLKGLISPSWD